MVAPTISQTVVYATCVPADELTPGGTLYAVAASLGARLLSLEDRGRAVAASGCELSKKILFPTAVLRRCPMR